MAVGLAVYLHVIEHSGERHPIIEKKTLGLFCLLTNTPHRRYSNHEIYLGLREMDIDHFVTDSSQVL